MGLGSKLKKMGRKVNKTAKKFGGAALKAGSKAANLATLGVAGKLMGKKRGRRAAGGSLNPGGQGSNRVKLRRRMRGMTGLGY
jgi:hypothetical protein